VNYSELLQLAKGWGNFVSDRINIWRLRKLEITREISMTEQQWKELSKYFLDNGNRKLSTEEKERIKLAIDQANNLNELLQVAFASLTIDAHR